MEWRGGGKHPSALLRNWDTSEHIPCCLQGPRGTEGPLATLAAGLVLCPYWLASRPLSTPQIDHVWRTLRCPQPGDSLWRETLGIRTSPFNSNGSQRETRVVIGALNFTKKEWKLLSAQATCVREAWLQLPSTAGRANITARRGLKSNRSLLHRTPAQQGPQGQAEPVPPCSATAARVLPGGEGAEP